MFFMQETYNRYESVVNVCVTTCMTLSDELIKNLNAYSKQNRENNFIVISDVVKNLSKYTYSRGSDPALRTLKNFRIHKIHEAAQKDLFIRSWTVAQSVL